MKKVSNGSTPKAPDYFKDKARKEWNSSLSELMDKRVTNNLDLRMFEEYCFQFDILDSLKEEMKQGPILSITNNGGGSTKIKNPAFTVYAETYDRIHKTAQQFGLTPLSRAKAKAPNEIPEDTPEMRAKRQREEEEKNAREKLERLRSSSKRSKLKPAV